VLDATPAPIYLVDQPLMNDLAGFNIHRGCLALVRRPDAGTLDRIVAGPMARVLVLEGVNNPDNVGGLFRSAAAFDIDLVVLGPDCVLPTGGWARTFSPLSVFDFLKRSSLGYVTAGAYPELAHHARILAAYEGFAGHAHAISAARDEA